MMRKLTLAAIAVAALTVYVGCGGQTPAPEQVQNASKDGDHGHKAGAHGGVIFSIGADNYHAEVRFEEDGVVRLFMLGRDETRVQEVEEQKMTAHALPDGATQSITFEIKADPQTDDAPGKTSQFIGRLPKELWGKKLSIVVPIRIAGERFRPTFKTPETMAHAGMPKGVARGSQKERELYLTPGGIYTEKDIVANGRMTPAEKFADISWPHDDNMKPGDKMCPITENKADPRCSWIVNGKEYLFCCSPCLDKFVGWAKNDKDRIKEPEAYIYRE